MPHDSVDHTLRALRASQERLQLATEAAEIGIWDWDVLSGRMTYSPRAKAICGFPPDLDVTYEDTRRVTHPDDYPRTSAMAQRALDPALREREPYQYRIVLPNGDVRWVLARGQALFEEFSGSLRAVRYLGTLQDISARMSLEEAENASKARLTRALNAGQLAVWEMDLSTRVLASSPELNAILGFAPNAPLSLHELRSRTFAGERERVASLWEDALDRGERQIETEYRYVWPDGSLHWLWLRAEIESDSSGRPQRAVGVLADVSERRRRETEALVREESLRLATAAGDVGTWDLDLDTDFLSWSDLTRAAFGISPGVPCTMDDFYAGLHPDDLEVTSAAFEAALDPARRETYDVEYRTIGKEDGLTRWVAAKGKGLFDETGSCIRAIGTAIDITRRKAVDEQLLESQAKLRTLNDLLEQQIAKRTSERDLFATIMQTTDAFIQVADLEYRFLAINEASVGEFERIFGIRPRIGDSMLDLLADQPEHQEAVRAIWSRALAGEEFTIVEEFGDPRLDRPCYEIRFNSLRNEAGERIGAYQFVYDVTERRREQAKLAETEAALRQSQKLEAMGQLTGGVAHDFNNLLTPILGSLDLLHRRKDLDERTHRLVDGGLQSAERARILVQRLLAFSRRQPLQTGAVDVSCLLTGMAHLIESSTGPHIDVIVGADAGLPAARADANQLEMAILNLAVNARDAMPDGGTLRITAAAQIVDDHDTLAPGCYVRLTVSDTGVGMDDETARRAIEPFFSTKGLGKGTGLGLSMAHGVASQLGGQLRIRSRLGEGSEIDLWLPATEEAPVGDVSLEESAPAGNRRAVVLLVDDEDLVRDSARGMLEDLGYEVIPAKSGPHALGLVQAGATFDILVTDHLMPEMSGIDLAAATRRERPGIPILIISGYAEVGGLPPDYTRLTKPFRQADLASSISTLLPWD